MAYSFPTHTNLMKVPNFNDNIDMVLSAVQMHVVYTNDRYHWLLSQPYTEKFKIERWLPMSATVCYCKCSRHSHLLAQSHHGTASQYVRKGLVRKKKKNRGPLVLYRSPECWGYVKISGYWGKHSQEGLITMVICCKFKKESLQPQNLYTSFHDLINVYWPQVRGRQSQGTKFWCQQKPLVTLVICYKIQKHLFEVWFYTIFFMILYMYIAPGQALTTPWDEILMSTGTSCHFGHLLQV